MADEKNNTGQENSGYRNTGDSNSGGWNSGCRNSGNRNSGDWNSGDCNDGDLNTGDLNSGYRNSGYRNTGDWNSGNRNSGDCNSGDCNDGGLNTGDRNSGNRNSGDWNSGSWNSGNGNSGNWNSGYGNSTNRSAGIFCTQEPKVICFDVPTDKAWDEIGHPSFKKFFLTRWIEESEMTEAEKAANPQSHMRGGYLKTYTWAEAWANYWRDSDAEEKAKVLGLPNFDAAKFKEITGIDVDVGVKDVSCAGKVVEIDGKKYKLVEA